MPRLPAVKPKDLIHVLESVGFFQHRKTSGSHLVLKYDDGRRTIVPVHSKDIPKGTPLAILKDSKISKEDFLRLL
ncbi:MAG: hypothetical protein UX39_C0025G0015 [Candidatus Magasanikbacteria bacterium GW2011_GWA2_46_17]|uniref:YcfA family protein n=1 Tax=Candidatus Magasanikbacteria bacterium GW2011_GWA2_46_17 TaxID=1619042 RepID=A0A0G1RXH6_9BACT|nr:MAG: hypothetical protein UX39_C0025G0015 [Candidatus Magasanikbacteria bacterium GW2011_GWA2_46_17]